MSHWERPVIGRLFVVVAVALTLAVGLLRPAIAEPAPRSAPTQPNVVVTIKPVHALVAQLLSGIVSPTLIVDGSASPHSFSLRPSQARAIASADVFIRVSEQVEPFTRKIVEAVADHTDVITVAELPGLTTYPIRTGAMFETHTHADSHDDAHAAHDDHDNHASDAAETIDGHVWLDPDNAIVIVQRLGEVLQKRYPTYATKIANNATVAVARLQNLTTEISGQLEPVRGKPFVVFHDAYQYFERRFGLQAVAALTVNPTVKPGARRLTEVRRSIAELQVDCVFAEPGYPPNLLAAVTEGSAVKSATLDVEGLTITAGDDAYDTLLRNLSRAISGCLTD